MLSAIKELPVPQDPVLHRPFVYLLNGDTARLSGELPPGEKENNTLMLTYELTLAREK